MTLFLYRSDAVDIDWQSYVATRILLFRQPDAAADRLYLPCPTSEPAHAGSWHVQTRTISALLEDYRAMERLGPSVAALEQYALASLFYYASSLMRLPELPEDVQACCMNVYGIATGYLKGDPDGDLGPIWAATRTLARETVNRAPSALEALRRRMATRFCDAIRQDLMASSCHPRRYAQCLDTDELRAWAQAPCHGL